MSLSSPLVILVSILKSLGSAVRVTPNSSSFGAAEMILARAIIDRRTALELASKDIVLNSGKVTIQNSIGRKERTWLKNSIAFDFKKFNG